MRGLGVLGVRAWVVPMSMCKLRRLARALVRMTRLRLELRRPTRLRKTIKWLGRWFLLPTRV